MTALTAPRSAHATRFERMLLTTAAGIDRFVESRLERRTWTTPPLDAQRQVADTRADALAMGAVGMLPR